MVNKMMYKKGHNYSPLLVDIERLGVLEVAQERA